MIADLPFSYSMTVLIAIGIVVAIIVIVCIIAATVYKARFIALENENYKSVADGGDRTEVSDLFHERYKNEGRTGLNIDDLL